MKKIITLVMIVSLIIGSFIGYGFGFSKGVSFAVHVGLSFVDIDINEQMLSTALWQYREQIGGCLFTENAHLFNNTRD